MLLRHSRQEARRVGQCEKRDVETIAEANETRPLVGSIAVEHAGQHRRLLGYDAHHVSPHASEAHHQIGGKLLLHFQEVPVVHDGMDDLPHVISLRRVLRHQRVQCPVNAVGRVGRRHVGRVIGVVRRQVREQPPHQVERPLIAGYGEVGHAAEPVVDLGATQFLGADLLARHRLDDAGAGDEHPSCTLDHEGEVSERGGVDRATSAWPHDDRDLGDDAGGQDVAVEDLAVGSQRVHSLLDACPARVVDPDNRCAVLQRQVEQFADFPAMGLPHRPAQHGEVLGEDVHRAAAYLTPAGDDTVAQCAPLGQAKAVP